MHSQRNIHTESWIGRLVESKLCNKAVPHRGCEQHREDLAKPWPGYPASPSTQCGAGSPDRNNSSSREMLAWCGSVLLKPAHITYNGNREFNVYEMSWWGYAYPLDASPPIEGGLLLTHKQVPHRHGEKSCLLWQTDHRLKPFPTKPTNEALSAVAGQQRKRSRETQPSPIHACICPTSCPSPLPLPEKQKTNKHQV